jgi:S-phase kinase-associated protein 1
MILEARDEQTCELPYEHAKLSRLLEDFEDDDTVPLPNATGTQLNVVARFCAAFQEAPPKLPRPLPDEPFADIAGDAYADMLDLEAADLFGLLDVSKYLVMPDLTELMYAKLAHHMKGKSVEELRAMFEVKNDFTAEEEADVREKYKCFD